MAWTIPEMTETYDWNSRIAHMMALLRVIRDQGGTYQLVKRGLEYSQIARLITKAISNGLLAEDADRLQLTQKGREFLSENRPHDQAWRGGGWITPLDYLRRRKLDPNEVYLPDD